MSGEGGRWIDQVTEEQKSLHDLYDWLFRFITE